MKIAISTESAADLTEELKAQYNIYVTPFTITLGERSDKDGIITGKELIDFTIKTGKLGKTSAINSVEYAAFFEEILKENDEVIHIALSGGITSSAQNAYLASQEFGGKVHVIDSLSLSTGVALEVLMAARLRDAGKSSDEIVKIVEERKMKNQTSFCFETVEFLYKGGRCSGMARFGANLLKLRPQIIMHTELGGKMESGKKFRGPVKKWVMDYVEETLKTFNNPDHELVFITHTIYGEEDYKIVDVVRERLKQEGFKNIIEAVAGATISCHCGPNTLGILYMNDGDHPVA